LARQLLTEGAVLALAGGSIGLAAAMGGVRLLRWFAPQGLNEIGPMSLDKAVLGFALGVTCLVTILFGMLPALAASRPEINETLEHSGARAAGEAGGRGMRKLLATAELALALVLVAGSGLLLRSFFALSDIDPGFNPHQVLTARLNLPQGRYSTSALQWGFLQRLLQRLSTLPGVTSVGATSVLPLSGYAGATAVRFEGQPSPPPGAAPSVPVTSASPDYFRTMGIPLLAGRFFNAGDGTHQDYPLIVNRSFAERFFSNQNAIGKRVRVGAQDWPWRTIVGVVGDVRQVGIAQPAEANIYLPYASPAGDPVAGMELSFPVSIVIRSKGNPISMAAGLRQQVAGIDPDLPVSDIVTMEQRLGLALSVPRFNATLLGVFAGFALLLSMVGIYGVIAYFASQRTHEIGIRMALGARPRSILRLLMGEAAGISLLGVALGVGGALALTGYLSSLLFEIRPTDPATIAGVALALAAAALTASYIPARRATKVDPMVALRYE
jgi:putative ABC transport system permease protein